MSEEQITDEVVVEEEELVIPDTDTREAFDVSGLGLGHRAMTVTSDPIDEESRTVQISISSEEPYERHFGIEVLEHSKSAIDTEFLESGRAPLLLDHDPRQPVGVIEEIHLDSKSRRLRARVRFGKSALAEEIFQDVKDGIRSNISVGYSIENMVLKERGSEGKPNTYVATKWTPQEASIVSIPADKRGAGVGRAAESEPAKPIIVEEHSMSEENTIDIGAVESNARNAANKNASQILELGARHNQSALAQKAIADGKSIDEFRGLILDNIGSEKSLENNDIGLTKKETQRFSLMRAINALANPHDHRAQEAAKFEFECSRAAGETYGRTAQGVMLPVEVLRNWTRALNSADEADLFTDDFRGSSFIDVLRNASSVMQAGATMLSGLSGDVKVPKKTTASTAAWVATEGGATTESEPVIGSVNMVPRQLGAWTDITRQLLQQSSLDVENLVRDDLAQALALAIDLAALEGTGASGQPTGLLSQAGLTKVAQFAGVNPTFAEVVSMESAVADANALSGSPAYILRSNMKGALKTTEKATGTAQFVYEPGNTINGYRAVTSNQGTDGNIYFGDFMQMLVGMWSGLDILVDPYTNSTSGTLRIVAMQTCDVAVRHIEAFSYGNDAI